MSQRPSTDYIGVLLDKVSGSRPWGWLTPGFSITENTFELLQAAGIRYTTDWVNDDQPYWLEIVAGPLLGIPLSQEAQAQAEAPLAAGKTVADVALGGSLMGLLAAQDPLRPDAQATLRHLQKMGLQVMLLTGDQAKVAKQVTEALQVPGIRVISQVHPADKAQAIQDLQTQGQKVAMVGDGINDAPALAQADVGIALHSATDAALETADIILMRNRLWDVVQAIRLSRATFRKIQQNLLWAVGYNLVGIPVAAGALLPAFGIGLSPAIAGGLMALSFLSVILNSLLLRRTLVFSGSPYNLR